jgi:hypothetical protein
MVDSAMLTLNHRFVKLLRIAEKGENGESFEATLGNENFWPMLG